MSSVAMSCRKRKCILKWLIVEEMEDDGIIETLIKPRQVIHPVFSNRTVEGYFKNLIMNHLRKDENKFLEFFRLSMAHSIWPTSTARATPVSYTHLDVYKRQVLMCNKVPDCDL